MRHHALLLALLPLLGCKQDMARQRRLGPDAPSALFGSGTAAQPLPAGVVPQEDARPLTPPPVNAALLERGRERYGIFCSPCHGLGGDGDGMVVRHGFPPPPSLHLARLRAAPGQHFFDVITQGHGVMYSYATRVAPPDRWAIAAYVRALQLARRVALAEVPDARERLP